MLRGAAYAACAALMIRLLYGERCMRSMVSKEDRIRVREGHGNEEIYLVLLRVLHDCCAGCCVLAAHGCVTAAQGVVVVHESKRREVEERQEDGTQVCVVRH